MTLEFLDSRDAITEKIRDSFENASEIRCIVAFWGSGALGLFDGMSKECSRGIRIVCNLTMGGTNPRIIEEMLDREIAVRHSPTLHSKVWWTDKGVIVGSANASANGLLLESAAQEGWLESALYSNHRRIIDEVGRYVDEMWCKSNEITRRDLEKARKNWRKRRPFSSPNDEIGFLDALKRGMFTDRDTPVYIGMDVDPAAEFQEDVAIQADEMQRQYLDLRDRELGAWVWERDYRIPLPPETFVISFFREHQGEVRRTGIWKTLRENCNRDGRSNSTYQYAYTLPVRKIGMNARQRDELLGFLQHLVAHCPDELAENLRDEGCYIPIDRLLEPPLRQHLDDWFGGDQ